MAKLISKKSLKWILPIVALALFGFIGFRWWKGRQEKLPEGIASGNGRIEATLVDVSAKEPLKVKELLVDEGDLVRQGQVLVRLDTSTLEADLAAARANLAGEEERSAVSAASILKQQSEIALAQTEQRRARNLVSEGAGSQRDLDVRVARVASTKAALAEAEAMQATSQQRIAEAKARADSIQTRIDDATLKSPVNGRVLYRLAEPGEVLGAGGKALTVVDLEDVYMEIFLPSEQAAGLKIGAEARLTVDFEPERALPATVSFVSPEAQFTPKQVETRSEREKLMFRVKLQVPKELAREHLERVKTGIRGVGYVKVKDGAEWPKRLQSVVPVQQPRASGGEAEPLGDGR